MDKKDKGLELAARFSSITNKLRYCGPKDAYIDFYKLLKGEKYDREKIVNHFKKYEGLYVYLDRISKKHNLDLLDYKVIESYWLGNELLDDFTKKDFNEIIKGLVTRGLPNSYAEDAIKRLPQGMNPIHSFNVLFIGVGRTSGTVPTNIITMNKCIVSVGVVLKITKRQLITHVRQLKILKGELVFSEPEVKYMEYIQEFLPGLKVKDKIAIHWDFACKILTRREETNLRKYTQNNIDALNKISYFKA
jgi:hypothetical protein